ncbi:MAG: bifunctional DNA primase/polymerase, partial [Ktedonobacteraceae bacterium]
MASLRDPLDYALKYARTGFHVFPLHSVTCGDCSCGRDTCSSVGKHPRTKNGVKDATTDYRQICEWWSTWPEANIGIATGRISNGLYVIDVDFAKGANLEHLAPFDLPTLTDTWTVETGSGGLHYYLRSDEALPNTAGKLAPFIDTRGEGGYVVAPPSFNKYGKYRWTVCIGEISALTPALLTFLQGQAGKTLVVQTSLHEQKQENTYEISQQTQTVAASDNQEGENVQAPNSTPEVVPVSSVVAEARNMVLMSIMGRLRAAGLAINEISVALLAINQERYSNGKHPQGPLPTEELERTILKSAAKYEAAGGVLPASVPQVETLVDLMSRELPETIWVVPGLLPEGLCMLGGKPKMGKSWL